MSKGFIECKPTAQKNESTSILPAHITVVLMRVRRYKATAEPLRLRFSATLDIN